MSSPLWGGQLIGSILVRPITVGNGSAAIQWSNASNASTVSGGGRPSKLRKSRWGIPHGN
ncbi:MAG: hypothetical protein AT710_00020 [Thermocladium sp. ECH_B]|nr:MAG: hypothetical protein AT710_00020 [Thermocladium sp. ECH_B]